MRQLATIQTIKDLNLIEGADSIEVATVKGWKVVVKKNEFNVGDKCVFFEIDSLLPLREEFEFLGEKSVKKSLTDNGEEVEGYRLKTVKLRGQISQGLALPLNVNLLGHELIKDVHKLEDGYDLTQQLNVHKYEPPIPASLSGIVRCPFPSFISKTDEERIQNCEHVLSKYFGEWFYVTEKLDGTSCTIYQSDDGMHVCSRNRDLVEGESVYWRVAKAYKFDEILEKYPDTVFQGEIVGESIQSNPLQIKGQKFYVFNIYDTTDGEYLNYSDMKTFIEKLNEEGYQVEMVPVLETEFDLLDSVDEMVELATIKSSINSKVWAEGMVFRPQCKEMQDDKIGRLSFKVINPQFLLKHE